MCVVPTKGGILAAKVYPGPLPSEPPEYTWGVVPLRPRAERAGGPSTSGPSGRRRGLAADGPPSSLFSFCLFVLLFEFVGFWVYVFGGPTGIGWCFLDLHTKLCRMHLKSGLWSPWGLRCGHFNFWSHFSLACSLAPSLARSLTRLLACSLGRPLARSAFRLLARSLARSLTP